ncbi:MAG: AraC family transcriptional regulator [bacterium]
MKKSSQYQSINKQNQSTFDVKIERFTTRLTPDFPILSQPYHQTYWRATQLLHSHDCLEIGYCCQGSGIFVIEQKIQPFFAGDVVVINDHEMHGIRNVPGGESDWIFLFLYPGKLVGLDRETPEILSTATLGGPLFNNIFRSATHPQIIWLVERVIFEMEKKESGYMSAVRALIWTIMVELHRLIEGTQTTVYQEDAIARLAPALEYIAHNYDEEIRVEDLATMCSVSDSTLRRLFQTVAGQTPQEYLNHLRINMASALLKSSKRTVLEIAFSVGFSTLSCFHRQFRQIMGTTPLNWRRGNR